MSSLLLLNLISRAFSWLFLLNRWRIWLWWDRSRLTHSYLEFSLVSEQRYLLVSLACFTIESIVTLIMYKTNNLLYILFVVCLRIQVNKENKEFKVTLHRFRTNLHDNFFSTLTIKPTVSSLSQCQCFIPSSLFPDI